MDGFEAIDVDVGATALAAHRAGDGPPVVLLHGFPQTHLMWRDIAPRLAIDHTVVCPDLRGYGASGCPPSGADHAGYSKRAMAEDVRALMATLGFGRFVAVGHDRGARVAYRLALDHPSAVERVAVLDIVPTVEVWERADDRLALSFWPWALLAQPEPLPERLLAGTPEAIVDDALGAWGTTTDAFPSSVRDAYVEALRDPAHVHAICEEYRAGATVDRAHDEADRAAGRRIACPLLALWSGHGALDTWYAEAGGPLAIWRMWADDVDGAAVDGGHFFPEARPEATADALRRFIRGEWRR